MIYVVGEKNNFEASMLWVVILAVAGCFLRTSAQPGLCASDLQCQRGFYCVPEVSLCQRCLDCGDLKRDPPSAPTACIRSVTECGSCIKGLVNDLRDDLTAECVVPPPAAGLPTWTWALVSLVLVLFMLVVGAVLFILRNTKTFKILASNPTSVRSPGVVASEPEAPPPYRAHYHHQPEHCNHLDTHDTHHYDTETDIATHDHRELLTDFVDPSAPCDDGPLPASPRAVRKPRMPRRGSWEASAHQETTYFCEPYYVRPPTYSDADVSPPASRGPEPPSLHDEDTMESTWTPESHDDHGTAAGGSELAELLAARLHEQRLHDQRPHDQRPYDQRLHDQRPHDQRPHDQRPHDQRLHDQRQDRHVQDSNNKRSSGSASSDADPGAGSSQAGPAAPSQVSYIINVVQNMQNRL